MEMPRRVTASSRSSVSGALSAAATSLAYLACLSSCRRTGLCQVTYSHSTGEMTSGSCAFAFIDRTSSLSLLHVSGKFKQDVRKISDSRSR